MSDAEARSRMQAVVRTPGLDVNYDCGRGDRPLHIENSQTIVSRIGMELFGISTPGPKTKEQLCLKYR